MEGSNAFEVYVRSSFERLGLEVSDADLAIMRVADQIYGPHTDALIEADLEGTAPEPDADFSKPPRNA
jgi:hypothetical protein